MERIDKLRELKKQLYEMMQVANSRSMAALARQYRETLRDIDAIENGEDANDNIAAIILRHRESNTDT